jgi:hypothetical protein
MEDISNDFDSESKQEGSVEVVGNIESENNGEKIIVMQTADYCLG